MLPNARCQPPLEAVGCTPLWHVQGSTDSRGPLRLRAAPGLATGLGDARSTGGHRHGGADLLRPSSLPDGPDQQPPRRAGKWTRHLPRHTAERGGVETPDTACRRLHPPRPPACAPQGVPHSPLLRLPALESASSAPTDSDTPRGRCQQYSSCKRPSPCPTHAPVRPRRGTVLQAMRGHTHWPQASSTPPKRAAIGRAALPSSMCGPPARPRISPSVGDPVGCRTGLLWPAHHPPVPVGSHHCPPQAHGGLHDGSQARRSPPPADLLCALCTPLRCPSAASPPP